MSITLRFILLDVFLMQYPVDGSWEDENLVFDAQKDEWTWPSDDALSSAQAKPVEVEEEVEEEDEAEDLVPTTDAQINAPMHTLGTTVKVSAIAIC